MPQSVILIPVPSADPIISKWREKYDRVVLHGIPSHITLLFPFKDPHQIAQEIIQKLKGIFSNIKQFSFVLDKINTFPNVIFLDPNPREKFIKLTEAIVHVFPENPPYEGKYKSINPHITIAAELTDIIKQTDSLKKQIEADISKNLPIQCVAKEAWLMIEDKNGEWHIRSKFLFLP